MKQIKEFIFAFVLDTAKMIRLSVVCTMVGSFCVFLLLWRGFAPWTTGVGAFFGSPLLVLGMVL